jgi:hypothetical protein
MMRAPMSTLPNRIRINRGDLTPFIGRHSGGQQFLSLVTGARRGPEHPLYAVLHTFDPDGRHLDTRVEPVGAVGDPQALRRAEAKQQEWLRQLPTLLLSSVEVEPFEVTREGVNFGLVAEGDVMRLMPAGLTFSAPWDGNYRT